MTVKDYFFVNCLYILCNVNILIIVTWLVILKANNRNTRTRCKIYSKLTIRTHGIYIVNFEHISHLAIVFLLLTLSRLMLAGYCLSSTQNLLHEKTKYSLRKVTCFLKFFLKGEHFLCSDYFI